MSAATPGATASGRPGAIDYAEAARRLRVAVAAADEVGFDELVAELGGPGPCHAFLDRGRRELVDDDGELLGRVADEMVGYDGGIPFGHGVVFYLGMRCDDGDFVVVDEARRDREVLRTKVDGKAVISVQDGMVGATSAVLADDSGTYAALVDLAGEPVWLTPDGGNRFLWVEHRIPIGVRRADGTLTYLDGETGEPKDLPVDFEHHGCC